MNILVIKLRQIGDVLLATPTIQALKRHFPDSSITVLVNAGTEHLLPGKDIIDEVLIYDRKWKKLPVFEMVSKEAGLLKALRSRRFDIAVNLTEGDRGIILSWLSRASIRAGLYKTGLKYVWKRFFLTHRVHMLWDEHVVEQNLHVIRKIGVEPVEADMDIRLQFDTRADEDISGMLENAGMKNDEKFVHIHPTSLWLFKAWRDDAMAEVIDYLQIKRGVRVVITCQDEKTQLERVGNILAMAESSPVNLSGKTTIKHLVALSKRSLFFFGIDTAPMHIAAAAGRPVVALFGPSDEKNFGPWSKNSTVITAPFDCRPCHMKGCDHSGRSECMEVISVDEVITVLDKVLDTALAD